MLKHSTAILFVVAVIPGMALAQQGRVSYNHTFPRLEMATDNIGVWLAEQDGEEYPLDPSHLTTHRTMFFTPAISLMYTTIVEGEVGDREDWEYVDTTYVNFYEGTYTESRELDGAIYLVKDALPVISWRLVDEERSYLGYRARKATAMIDTMSIEAWFAPELPVTAGPGLYGGLPGLILMVTNVTIGEVYAAEAIDLDEIVPQTLAPINGRVVSRTSYDRQVERLRVETQRTMEKVRRKLN